MSEAKKIIAVLGGTGKEGGGLALRWAHAGHPVIVGSRTAERAEEAAAGMRATLGAGAQVRGATNADAANAAEIVVLSVPFAAQQATVREVAPMLQNKILSDVTRAAGPTEGRPGPASGRRQRREGHTGAAGRGRAHRLGLPEHLHRGKRSWCYREVSPHNCVFSCPGSIRERHKLGLIGGPLAGLAVPHPALKDARILEIDDTADGWSEVRIDPSWVMF